MGDMQHAKRKRKVLPQKKKNPRNTTTGERKEGEGVRALPRGNVITMLGSQFTASG